MGKKKRKQKKSVLQLLFFKESHFQVTNRHSENFLRVIFFTYTSGLILYLIKFNMIVHCNFFTMLILGNVSPHNYLLRDARAESKWKLNITQKVFHKIQTERLLCVGLHLYCY